MYINSNIVLTYTHPITGYSVTSEVTHESKILGHIKRNKRDIEAWQGLNGDKLYDKWKGFSDIPFSSIPIKRSNDITYTSENPAVAE